MESENTTVEGLTCELVVRKGANYGYYGRHECCGKKAKGRDGHGRVLCGLHLANALRKEEEQRIADAKWEARKAFEVEVQQLSEKLGVSVQNTGGWGRRLVSISLDDLLALVEKKEVL